MPEYPSCVRLTFLYSSWRKIKFTALRIWDCNSLQGGGDAPNSSSLLFSLFPPQFVFVVGKSWNILTFYIFRLILNGLVETLKWYAETECLVIVMMVTTLGSCEWLLWTVQLLILMMVKYLGSREWCSGLRSTELPWVSAMPAENFNFRWNYLLTLVKVELQQYFLETAEPLFFSSYSTAWYLVILENPWETLWVTT